MKNELLKDVNGNLSSKRVAGFMVLLGGLSIVFYAVLQDPSLVREAVWPVFMTGGGLLGVSVMEKKP